MSRIYAIRHGRPASAWGDGAADPDPGLDPQGLRQAQAAAERLAALPVDLRPTRILSSPLRRCRETAAPASAALDLPVEVDARFGEIPTPENLGPQEREPWLRRAFAGRWADIEGDGLDYGAWRRGVAAGFIEQRQATAVFSHFVAINAAVSCATGEEHVLAFRPDHASITVFGTDLLRLVLIERGSEASTQVL